MANLGDLPSSITQSQKEVSKMVTESRGVILKKDHPVHAVSYTPTSVPLQQDTVGDGTQR